MRYTFSDFILLNPFHKLRPCFSCFQIGHQFFLELGIILKREFLSRLFHKKIKWIDDLHPGNDLYFDTKLSGFFRKNDPRLIITERVLLPVDKMLLRPDL